jgi:hypothetical protein
MQWRMRVSTKHQSAVVYGCVPQAWLKAPLVEPAAIQQRLDIVEAMVTDQGLREAVRDALRGALPSACNAYVCAWAQCNVHAVVIINYSAAA